MQKLIMKWIVLYPTQKYNVVFVKMILRISALDWSVSCSVRIQICIEFRSGSGVMLTILKEKLKNSLRDKQFSLEMLFFNYKKIM